MPEKIIMYDSQEAASLQAITGWVSRDGLFFGKNEKSARYRGCTHVTCECGGVMKKMWTKCDECREKAEIARYEAMPKAQWDGKTPLYSQSENEYIMDIDELDDFFADRGIFQIVSGVDDAEYRLVICLPELAREIDPEEYYELSEDESETPYEIAEAFKELNKRIRECKDPMYWVPGKFAAII